MRLLKTFNFLSLILLLFIVWLFIWENRADLATAVAAAPSGLILFNVVMKNLMFLVKERDFFVLIDRIRTSWKGMPVPITTTYYWRESK